MDIKCGCNSVSSTKPSASGTTKSGENQIVIYINSATMGDGDDKLGANLMGVYLDTLSNFAHDISHIILVNSAVKLACQGSEVIEQLQNLAGTGTSILSCGTCLNFFEIKEQLEAGVVSNMFEIIEVMKNSSKILSP